MKKRKLISMVGFILNIDWMTTTEFCNEYGVPLPKMVIGFDGKPDISKSSDTFLQVDAIKHKMFVDYAKFLNKELTIDMFEGERKIFEGGKYIDRQPSENWNTYEINGKKIFEDSNGKVNGTLHKRVCDLIPLGVYYNEINFK